MIKIYLASRYSRHVELQGYARDLRDAGFVVTSRWIEGNHQLSNADLAADGGADAKRQAFAEEDWRDLMDADICISFTEEPRSGNSRGGRHVEFGIALAAGMQCIIVGPREKVFHCLPQAVVFETWEGALRMMRWGR